MTDASPVLNTARAAGMAEGGGGARVAGEALAAIRAAFVAIALFSCAIGVLMLTTPLYMLQVYDRVLTSRSLETLTALTLLAGGLLLALGALELARGRLLVRITARLELALGAHLFDALAWRRLRGEDAGYGGALRDLDIVRAFATGPALLGFFEAPLVPAFILLIFAMHPALGALAGGGAAVFLAIALFSEGAVRGPLRLSALCSAEAARFGESGARPVEAAKAMGLLEPLRRRWSAKHVDALALQSLGSDRNVGLSALAKLVRPLLQIGLLGVGAALVLRDEITPGVMIAASIIFARALAPTEAAIAGWRGFVQAREAYRRLRDLLERTPCPWVSVPLRRPCGHLSLVQASAKPPGGNARILQNVSFELSPGELLGVIGPSGAGKSALARLAVGVWPASEGSVRLDGADLFTWDPAALGPHIGYLPQQVDLIDGTVMENIARFREADGDLVREAARRAGAHEAILRLSRGYETEIGPRGARLSGGQRQLIGLARALYGGPAFVVLDEPSSNLDAGGEGAVRRALLEMKRRGATCVLVSHRPSLVATADKLLVLRDGKVEMFGPRAEVLPRVMRPLAAVAGP